MLRAVTNRLGRVLPDVERLDIPRASHDLFETDPDEDVNAYINELASPIGTHRRPQDVDFDADRST